MANKMISELQYRHYEKERDRLKAELAEALRVRKEETDDSDKSENASRDQAIEDIKLAEIALATVEEYLTYNVVGYDKSETITEGSLVEVSSEKDTGIYLLSSVGDALMDRVINIDSPLGSAILGQYGGTYRINGNEIHVKKVKDDLTISKFGDTICSVKDLFKQV